MIAANALLANSAPLLTHSANSGNGSAGNACAERSPDEAGNGAAGAPLRR